MYMLDLCAFQINVATAEKKKIEDVLNLLITKYKTNLYKQRRKYA